MASGNAVVLFSGVQGGQSLVFVSGASGSVQVSSNSTGGNSDLGNPSANDFIISATIASIWWSVGAAGSILIARGANTILNLSYTGAWLRADGWPGCNLYSSANVVVTLPNANAMVYIELSKEYPAGDNFQQTS